MMKKTTLVLICLTFFAAWASPAIGQTSLEQKKGALLSVIDEELREVLRLNKQTQGRNPDLRIQAAELELEKARILREIEMDRFLAIDSSKRSSINKDKFFAQSTSYFNEAKKQCIYVLKNYPSFSGKADAYYILAYHARDIDRNTNKAAKYFEQARSSSRRGTPLYDKASMALAEMYYNQKQYQRAIPLYQAALAGQKNRWWTKDAHSLAWSYFRVGEKQKGIELLEQVDEASKNSNFIDMSAQAKRDLAYFYTASGKTDQAVSIATKNGGNAVESLISVAIHARNQGHFDKAGNVLLKALGQKPDRAQEIKIHLAILDIADRMGKFERIYSSSKKLSDIHLQQALEKEQLDQLKFYAQKSAATLQGAVMGKAYRHQPKVRMQKGDLTVKFFEILKNVNPEGTYKIDMLIAETYFSLDQFGKAVPFYDSALAGAQRANDRKIEQDALAGLSTSLDKPTVGKDIKDKYLSRTYLAYLQKNPKSPEAHKIYQRLFNLYLQQKDMKNCEQVLLTFKKYFPNDRGLQEAMLGQIIDIHKANKDSVAMKSWLDRIDRHEFDVNPTFKSRLSSAITTMKFENVETANTRGDKVSALKGYMALYGDANSSDYEKKNAAYNIAVLFNMLGNDDMTYKWTMRALEKMQSADVLKFESSFLAIATFLFNKRKFEWAIDVNHTVYQKLCSEKSANKEVFFKNIYVLKIAEEQSDEISRFLSTASSCSIPQDEIDRARLELLVELERAESWQTLEEQLLIAERNKKLWGELIIPANALHNAYSDAGRSQSSNQFAAKIEKYFVHAEANKLEIPLEARDIVANFKLKSLYAEAQKLDEIQLSFPESIFNERLKQKLAQLEKISARALDLSKVRSGKGIVRAYRYLVDSYEKVSSEVTKFSPPGVTPEYLQSFKKALVPLANNLTSMAQKFRQDVMKEISSSTILSSDNTYFMMDHHLPVKVEYKFYRKGMVMDRGGQR